VSVDGGTRVTITGSAIPANAQVRIGLTTPAVVSTVSTTRLVFTTPALVAGSYDVYVSIPGGSQSSVLTGGLTYLMNSSAPSSSAASTTASGAPGSTATAGPATPTWVTGPHGERLVRSALFGSLGPSIWKVNCASSCSGLAV
jgi:serine protease